RAHTGLGEAARRRGDLPSAIAHTERALTLLERLEMRRLQVRLLHELGEVQADAGHTVAARASQERALAGADALGDLRTAAGARERCAAPAATTPRRPTATRRRRDSPAECRAAGR